MKVEYAYKEIKRDCVISQSHVLNVNGEFQLFFDWLFWDGTDWLGYDYNDVVCIFKIKIKNNEQL